MKNQDGSIHGKFLAHVFPNVDGILDAFGDRIPLAKLPVPRRYAELGQPAIEFRSLQLA